MAKKKKLIYDAVEILHRRYFEGHPDRIAALEEERANAEIARQAYDLRTRARLSHRQLAKRVGVKPQIIDDLENADYDGNYIGLLQRIAVALNKRVEIRCVSAKAKSRSA